MGPRYGPLLDSGGFVLWARILYMVYNWNVLASRLGTHTKRPPRKTLGGSRLGWVAVKELE